jgi:hypothetical protein
VRVTYSGDEDEGETGGRTRNSEIEYQEGNNKKRKPVQRCEAPPKTPCAKKCRQIRRTHGSVNGEKTEQKE